MYGHLNPFVNIIWINLGFWETAHLPLPWANILA